MHKTLEAQMLFLSQWRPYDDVITVHLWITKATKPRENSAACNMELDIAAGTKFLKIVYFFHLFRQNDD